MAYSDRYKENSLLTSSLDGLTLQTLRTTGFKTSDFDNKKYYPIALLLDGSFMAEWFEYKLEHPSAEWTEVFEALETSYKPDGSHSLSTFKENLTQADQESLAKFIGSTNSYFGVMAPAWIDSPAWLITLISLYKRNHSDKNFWYFPLQASKTWFKGFFGSSLASELSDNTATALYSRLFRKGDTNLPDIVDLLHTGDSEKVMITQFSQWPAPVSGEIAKTYQGIRSSSYIPGVTKNLIVNTLSGVDSTHINPVKATDNYLIASGGSALTFNLSQLLPSGYTPESGNYTFSFYAKYDGEAVTQPSNRYPKAVSFSWNGTTKTYPLYNSWKRYYISGPITTALQNYSVTISASSLFPPVRIAGLLFEQTSCPSPYNPAWHTINSTYVGPKQYMPILYQLPLQRTTVAGTANETLQFSEGTIIYKKYIEDHGLAEHWDSLGFSDSKYINWGFNNTGHPELKVIDYTAQAPETTIADSSISLAGHEDSWTLNILRFTSNQVQWTVYAKPDLSSPLINLTLAKGHGLAAEAATCSTSSYLTPNDTTTEYTIRYNLALGSRLHRGDDGDQTEDPYYSFFSSNETEVENPDNSVFEDLVYCNWVLSDAELQELATRTLQLKVQSDNGITELSVISGSINQSGYGRAYIAGIR